jgi:hypothetical protein
MSHKSVYFLIVVSGALLLGVVASAFLFLPSVRAHKVLADVRTLEVGKTTFDDANRVAIRIKAIPSTPCSPADCLWYVRIDNSTLPKQWRGPITMFSAQFRVKDSVISERAFSSQIGTGPNISIAEVDEQMHWRGNTTEPLFVTTQTAADTPHYRAFVRLTPAVSPDVRNRYLSFNLSCLWKHGGCGDAQELLPTVDWK